MVNAGKFLVNGWIFLFFLSCILLSVSAATCEKGYYKSCGGGCEICPAGTYNDVSGAQGLDACSKCPRNTISRPGSVSRSQCKACPKGSSSHPGGAKCVSCPRGSYNNNNFNCEKCDYNTIAPGTDALECTECEGNTVHNKPRTKCVQCGPGSNVVEVDSRFPFYKCKRCKAGYYNDGSFRECKPCREGTTSNREKTKCEDCPSGTANPNLHRSCIRCRKGKNLGVVGSGRCIFPGAECPARWFKTSKGACIICYPNERVDPKLGKCVPCENNSISQGGNNTKCEPCPKGSVPDFIEPYFFGFEKNRCICQSGWSLYPDGSCRYCPAGRYVSFHKIFSGDDPETADSCIECPDGTFSTGGQVYCEICPDGFEPNTEKTGCKPCPSGLRSFVLGEEGSEQRSRCVDPRTNCPPGEFRNVRSCYDGEEDFNCGPKTCPKNTTASFRLGQKKCISCPIGSFYYDVYNGDDFFGYCTRCPKGLARPDRPGCEKCPRNLKRLTSPNQLGSYCGCVGTVFLDSILSNGRCIFDCKDGEETRGSGFPYKSRTCEKCLPGTAFEFDPYFNPLKRGCDPCDLGYFADKPGQTNCQRCPDGETTLSTGSTSCVPL